MAHTVTAPLVIAKTEQGSDIYLYRDAPVPAGQSEEWIATHLDTGMIAEVDTVDLGEGEAGDAPPPDPVAAFLDRPAEQVIADVDSLTDEDRAEVLTAEEAGKARVTVLRALKGEAGDAPPGQ